MQQVFLLSDGHCVYHALAKYWHMKCAFLLGLGVECPWEQERQKEH